MAQSPTERLTMLERRGDVQAVRLDAIFVEVDTVRNADAETVKEVAVLNRNFDRELALLKRELEELKKWQDDVKKGQEEWGRKLWMILPPVLAVFISSANFPHRPLSQEMTPQSLQPEIRRHRNQLKHPPEWRGGTQHCLEGVKRRIECRIG